MTGLVHDAPKRSKIVLRKYFKGWVCVFSLSENLLKTSIAVLAVLSKLTVLGHLKLLFNQSYTSKVLECKHFPALGLKKKTTIKVP